jgi:hypothetical protein
MEWEFQTFSKELVFPPLISFIDYSLERDYHKRPSPRQLLNDHPWVLGIAKIDVDMERWIREVWEWSA